jgi:hypothetical protein
VQTARALGISPRRLWGWEAREVHTHEYDADGRVQRVVVEREPEWDQESYAFMVALTDLETAACDGCGEPMAESMDFAANPDNRDGTHLYKADDPSRCFACDAREKKAAEFEKAGGDLSRALRFPVIRVERERRPAGG